MLEKAVGDGAEAVVRALQGFAHRVPGARIVERGHQDERAISHVAIRVLGDGLQQGGHRLRRGCPPDDARRVRADRIVQLPEIVDRGRELRRGDRLRRRRLLPSRDRVSQRDKNTKERTKNTKSGLIASASLSAAHLVTASVSLSWSLSLSLPLSLSSFSASCRYVASSRGNSTG